MTSEGDASGAEELPDRLVILNGSHEGWSLRLDRGPVYIGDREECTVRLNPYLFEDVRVIVCLAQSGGGPKPFEFMNQGKLAVINGKVRTFHSRLAHGDTITIYPNKEGAQAFSLRLVARGRDDEDEVDVDLSEFDGV